MGLVDSADVLLNHGATVHTVHCLRSIRRRQSCLLLLAVRPSARSVLRRFTMIFVVAYTAIVSVMIPKDDPAVYYRFRPSGQRVI